MTDTIPKHLKPEQFESSQHDPSGQCFVDLDEVNEKLDIAIESLSLNIERTFSALLTENNPDQRLRLESYIMGLNDCLRIIKNLK